MYMKLYVAYNTLQSLFYKEYFRFDNTNVIIIFIYHTIWGTLIQRADRMGLHLPITWNWTGGWDLFTEDQRRFLAILGSYVKSDGAEIQSTYII